MYIYIVIDGDCLGFDLCGLSAFTSLKKALKEARRRLNVSLSDKVLFVDQRMWGYLDKKTFEPLVDRNLIRNWVFVRKDNESDSFVRIQVQHTNE